MELTINISVTVNGETINIPVSTDEMKDMNPTLDEEIQEYQEDQESILDLPTNPADVLLENYDIIIMDRDEMDGEEMHDLFIHYRKMNNALMITLQTKQLGLATKLGISQGTLSNILNERTPSKKILIKHIEKMQTLAILYLK